MPTRYEMTRIAQEASRLTIPKGEYFRLAAYDNLFELLDATFGPEHPLTGRVVLGHARELAQTREYAQSQAQLARAKAIFETRLADDAPEHFNAGILAITLLDFQGRHLDQLAASETLAAKLARLRPDDRDFARAMEEIRSVALYRLGRYEEAAILGARLLDEAKASAELHSPLVQGFVAGQAMNLLRSGKLREAEALFDRDARLDLLNEDSDRFVLARLYRAEAAMKEAQLDFDGAREAFQKAYDLYSGKAYRLAQSNSDINPDKGQFAAMRTALDMARLSQRKFPSLGLTLPGWRGHWVELDIAGKEHLKSDIRLENVPEISDRLAAQVVRNQALWYNRTGWNFAPAEPYWRALLDYAQAGTGPGSIPTAQARADLADNLLRQGQAFAAEDEALAALEVLDTLPVDHPSRIMAQSTAAIASARQGLGQSALGKIDAALAALAPRKEQSKESLLALLNEKDRLLKRSGDVDARQAHWEQWAGPMVATPMFGALGAMEDMVRATLSGVQAEVDYGDCPPPELLATFRKTADGMRVKPPEGEPFTPSQLIDSAFVVNQIIAEGIACEGDHAATFEALKRFADPRETFRVKETGPQLVARLDRWAKMLLRDPDVIRIPERRELLFLMVSQAESVAENQIEIARSAGSGTDARQRRVLASQGEGFVYRYALETRIEANWRYSEHVAREGRGQSIGGIAGRPLREDGFDEAFRAAQLLRLDRNSQTLALASARAAAPDARLRDIVGRYQTVGDELYRLLVASQPDQNRLSALQAEHAQLDRTIAEQFPQYHEFAAPKPLGFYDTIGALDRDEGLLMIIPVGEDIYVFAASRQFNNQRAWHRVENGVEEVETLVALLRCDIDPVECGEGGMALTRGGGDALDEWRGHSFDRNSAWALYDLLIRPVAHVFEKKESYETATRRLYAVTSGAISALPLSLLLTAPPEDDGLDTTGSVFRDAPWLADRFDIAYLPSVSDLTGTRRAEVTTSGFTGYGDPVLAEPLPEPATVERGAALFQASRGGPLLADPRALKDMKSLPGAAKELEEAAALFPETSRLVTKAAATEPNIRSDGGLAGSKVILLATHGVLPNPDAGFAEPGLVMTPPDTATQENDGLLSASEAAALDFTSELLILSACNTASAGSLGSADSLSGLARAFIFAGAGSVYASHWRVSDTITKELILLAIRYARDDPSLSRSEALGKAMTAIRRGEHEDGTAIEGWTPDWSHPSAWAPFVAITSLERQPDPAEKQS